MTEHRGETGDDPAAARPVATTNPWRAGDRPSPAPRRRASPKVRRRRLLVAAIAIALVLVGAVGWFFIEADPLGASGPDALVYVSPGEPLDQLVGALAGKGIVSSGLAFRLDLAVQGTPTIVPGWYAIPTSSSFSAVRAALGAGPNALAIEVSSGETTREMAAGLLDVEDATFARGFLSDARNGVVRSPYQDGTSRSLEGLLAPGVYVLTPRERPTTLLTQMVQRFDRSARAAGLLPTTRRHGLDAYRLVVLASIVEKEGYYPRNMPKTATVIFNRLARGMPLQMDSTVEYAIGQDGGPVTSQTEAIRSPYNTYLHAGLTPTPICSVSSFALHAALHPPAGPWLFFTLISEDGTMAFASTFAQQLANERLAARRGIS